MVCTGRGRLHTQRDPAPHACGTSQPSTALPGYQGLILFPTHILMQNCSSLPSVQELQIAPENALGL